MCSTSFSAETRRAPSFLEELRHAADRGVRVRILVDDGDTKPGDEHVLELDGYPNMEVRVFNPFDYRGHNARAAQH